VVWILSLGLEDLTGFCVKGLISPFFFLSELHSKFQILIDRGLWLSFAFILNICFMYEYIKFKAQNAQSLNASAIVFSHVHSWYLFSIR
jgi:hypothetical protein